MKSPFKERLGWYIYDWANSAFSTCVVTVFIGPYLTYITHNSANSSGYVYALGIQIYYGSFFPYIVSLSVILQVFILPILGAIADYTNLKKLFLGIFAYIGAFSTMLLYFLDGNNYIYGGILFIIANLSFGASCVFYNAYINDISDNNNRDNISSIGWAFGYLGGGIILLANLILISNINYFNISMNHAIRISLCSAGLWWALFTVFPMIMLKNKANVIQITSNRILLSGFKQLLETIKEIPNYPQTMIFLIAYLFYNDGVQAVIALSAQFGQEELGLSIETLTSVILLVQFVAFLGAILFNYIAKLINTKNSIIISLIIWILLVFYAYEFLYDEVGFYFLGASIAIVMGGTQALSRSLFSRLIPEGKESEYFSLYEVSERGTSWMGPFIFGLSLQFSGSYRIAILSLIIFFIIGLFVLFVTRLKKVL